ncbi:MAG: T9SS type A sorting domain-containing protein [Bacteroidia bacterium]
MQKRFLTGVFFIFCLAAKAQLTFPNGTNLNLTTGTNYLYEETGIFFHTGNFKVTDYNYEKIFDSTDSRWTVSSCMNGYCLGMPDYGSFIKDFGINDTTGFIRFHVFTHDFNGTSRIAYRVINATNFMDQAILNFTITFKKSNGIKEAPAANDFSVFPNPSNGIVEILNQAGLSASAIAVFDLDGKEIKNAVKNYSTNIVIDLSGKSKGIYFLKIISGDQSYYRKLIIN